MIKGYYFITDALLSKHGNISDVKAALAAGVKVVQYRNKNASIVEALEEARELRQICSGITFLINDSVELAQKVNADGVHLGSDDAFYEEARKALGPDKIIGLTVHNVEEAQEAEAKGADYLGVSPIFSTTTKSDAGNPVGVKLVQDVKNCCKIPIVAIGGINLDNAPEVVAAGADALCAISAVITKDDVAGEIRKFQSLWK